MHVLAVILRIGDVMCTAHHYSKMRVLYIKGHSPNSEKYDRLSLFSVYVLAAGGSFSSVEPADRAELEHCLKHQVYDIVYYRGHGTTDGDWILKNEDVITRTCVTDAIGIGRLVVILSTACFSHKWTVQAEQLRYIGSTSSYKPFEKGSGLFNYLLQFGLDAAVHHLYGKTLKGRKFISLAHYRSAAFELVESFFNSEMAALDINLKKLVPDHISELRVADYTSNVKPLPSENGCPYPRGFPDWQAFCSAVSKLAPSLGNTFVFHGSSVTGYRFKKKPAKGLWFDDASDYDLAICNGPLYNLIVLSEPSMEKEGNHTEEITLARNTWFQSVHSSAETTFCRTVNFMVYKSLEDAQHHAGLSLVVIILDNAVTTYLTGEQLDFLKWTLV
jgi:hypothetical protein